MAVALLALAACTSSRPAVRHAQPEPRNPDLGAVMERYYQGVTSERWAFVRGMLAEKTAAAYPVEALAKRYGAFRDADVRVAEAGPYTLRTTLTAGARRAQERAHLRWDGERWTIDRLAPDRL